MSELAFASALEQAALVRAGEVSALELVELYLTRIESLDPQLNAFVTVAADRAREEARSPRPGPFSGVPLPIKDLHETEGIRTTFSCRAFADNVPEADAGVVRRLRAAGFIVIGKTNTPELGTIAMTESELNGACRNPWNPERTPGGSSGGAAVAVAAGLSPAAQASDGGGSIRIPAACCGLFGLKPSRGRVSPAPYGPGALGLGTSGPIARTVADAAALLDVMSGYEPGDPYVAPPPARAFAEEVAAEPGRLRVAVTTEPPVTVPVDPQCAAAVDTCAELLAGLGHEVVEATPPWQADQLRAQFMQVWQVGPGLAGVDPAQLEPLNRMLLEDARASSAPELATAIVRLQAFARTLAGFWADVDVLVTPVLALPPVPIGWSFEPADLHEQFARQWQFTPFTAVHNVTGHPAASVPFGFTDDGLPLGVQLVGSPFGDALLLRLAAQLEQARPWAHLRPPLAA